MAFTRTDRAELLRALNTVQPGLSPAETVQQWRDVRGYVGFYQVSDYGRVRSVDRICFREYRGSVNRKGNPLKLRVEKSGYVRVGLRMGSPQKVFLVHRLMWEAFFGAIPEGKEVNHKNGVKWDNRLTNLELTTHKGNLEHASENGLLRPCKGEDQGSSKLTGDQVRQMRKDRSAGASLGQLARRYGVGKSNVSFIVNGKTWRHL